VLSRLLLDGLGTMLWLGFAALGVSGVAVAAAGVASLLTPPPPDAAGDDGPQRRGRLRELRRYATWWLVVAVAWAVIFLTSAPLRAV
jgi:hypothetical protein